MFADPSYVSFELYSSKKLRAYRQNKKLAAYYFAKENALIIKIPIVNQQTDSICIFLWGIFCKFSAWEICRIFLLLSSPKLIHGIRACLCTKWLFLIMPVQWLNRFTHVYIQLNLLVYHIKHATISIDFLFKHTSGMHCHFRILYAPHSTYILHSHINTGLLLFKNKYVDVLEHL